MDKLKQNNTVLETECARLQLENLDLLDESSDTDSDCEDEGESILQSIIGNRRYSPEIRKLYYSLLAEQVPLTKISKVIRSVLKCFNPSVDVDGLKLPQKTCASYMRREELSSVCNAH